MRRTLVLASSAVWRGELLAQLQVPFEQASPQLDESPWMARNLPPKELTEQLARAKARALSDRFPTALLLGADQVVDCDGQVLGKPGSTEAARAQLELLAGREHRLVTGLCLWDPLNNREFSASVTRTMTMRKLTSAEIADYVQRDSPEQCAGSYRIESLGIALFASIDGDSSGVVGLPLMEVTNLLRSAGLPVLKRDG